MESWIIWLVRRTLVPVSEGLNSVESLCACSAQKGAMAVSEGLNSVESCTCRNNAGDEHEGFRRTK